MGAMRLQLRALTASVALLLGVAAFASAQGRATGTVKDTSGKAIKGATVRASNPDASPSQFASATDDRGRWAMIGLRSGTWHFTVEAPGYFTVETNAPVRVAAAPPMQFALAKDPGPIPNALDRNIQQLIEDAASMRDAGRIDQALAAYQDIRSRNPKLTSVNLVIGDLYRRKATQETDPGARQNLYQQALDAYDLMLKSDATNERALAESAAIRAATRNE
jgi:tetratricopeptide (TPR) repeat protein